MMNGIANLRDGVRTLIVGRGNIGLQDEGLGPTLAAEIEALDWPHVDAYETDQLAIEDAMDVAEHDVVWFVDAARSGPAPFVVSDIVADHGGDIGGRSLRPESLLRIAEHYYQARPRAYLLAIRGYGFDEVEALTPMAAENLRAAVVMLKQRIGADAMAIP